MGAKTVITDDMKDRFIEDYEAAGNINALAAKWGINWRTAKGALIRFDVDLSTARGRGGIPREKYHPKLGVWSDRRVAKELGISRQAVARARKRRGVDSAWGRALSITGAE
jgi:hypothetical protein